MADTAQQPAVNVGRSLLTGLARAFGGAVFFSLPLLMTMEMWWLGFYMDRLRLALFILLTFPLLVALNRFSGFKASFSWLEDVVDATVAYGVGFVASAAILLIFGVIETSMPLQEIAGKISLQAVPASIGAVLATSQLGGRNGDGEDEAQQKEEQAKRRAGYGTEVFLMGAGALFFAFNVAPTEEMVVIGFKMSYLQALGLALASLLMMHAFVYSVEFRGAPSAPEGTPWWSLFLRFTIVGYAMAVLISAYVLWTFGRYDGLTVQAMAQTAVVLAFPASLGASAARLVL